MLQVSYADMEFIPHFFLQFQVTLIFTDIYCCCIEHAFCKHNNSHQLDSTTLFFLFFWKPLQNCCWDPFKHNVHCFHYQVYISAIHLKRQSPEIEMVHCFITQSLCLVQYYFCFYQITVFTDICYLFSAVLMYPKTKVCYFVIFWFLKFTF